jgi:hypothetical protein
MSKVLTIKLHSSTTYVRRRYWCLKAAKAKWVWKKLAAHNNRNGERVNQHPPAHYEGWMVK